MGKYHEEKIEIMRKYLFSMTTGFYIKGNIPSKKLDKDCVLEITQYDGEKILITSSFVNKTPLKEFLEIMKEYDNTNY